MKTAKELLERAESEAEFERKVVEYAHLKGWAVAGFRPARVTRNGRETYETPTKYDAAGWPDLILIRGLRILAYEVKSAKGRLRPEQEAWLLRLGTAGVTTRVVKPSDWDRIVEELR